MSEFCYVIDDQKGSRLQLCGDGVQRESADLAERLDRDGFRHVEDRAIGSCILHVFKRAMPATDIVASERRIAS